MKEEEEEKEEVVCNVSLLLLLYFYSCRNGLTLFLSASPANIFVNFIILERSYIPIIHFNPSAPLPPKIHKRYHHGFTLHLFAGDTIPQHALYYDGG